MASKEAKGVATIPVGCVVRTKEDIIHALEDGADYICLAGDVVDKRRNRDMKP